MCSPRALARCPCNPARPEASAAAPARRACTRWPATASPRSRLSCSSATAHSFQPSAPRRSTPCCARALDARPASRREGRPRRRLAGRPARRTVLTKHRNSEIATLCAGLLAGRADVVAGQGRSRRVCPALKLSSDARRGSEVFGKLCATCHRVGNVGHAVGPDLTATQFREPDAL